MKESDRTNSTINEAYNAALSNLKQAELDYKYSLMDYRNCEHDSRRWSVIKDTPEFQALTYGLQLLKSYMTQCLQALTQAQVKVQTLRGK